MTARGLVDRYLTGIVSFRFPCFQYSIWIGVKLAGTAFATEKVCLIFVLMFASLGWINSHTANWINYGDLHSFHV
jgi:hypothetical protein